VLARLRDLDAARAAYETCRTKIRRSKRWMQRGFFMRYSTGVLSIILLTVAISSGLATELPSCKAKKEINGARVEVSPDSFSITYELGVAQPTRFRFGSAGLTISGSPRGPETVRVIYSADDAYVGQKPANEFATFALGSLPAFRAVPNFSNGKLRQNASH